MSYETVAKYLVPVVVMSALLSSAIADRETGALNSVTDAAHERAYMLVRDGVEVLEPSTGRKVAQVELPGWIWATERYSCPPAIALGPGGDVLVTSNVLPTIWRIDHRTLATTTHEPVLDQDKGRDIGFTRLRWSQKLGSFVGSTDLGETWYVDRDLSRARKISNTATGGAVRPCQG